MKILTKILPTLFEKVYKYVLVTVISVVLAILLFYNTSMSAILVNWESTVFVKEDVITIVITIIAIILLIILKSLPIYKKIESVISEETNYKKIKMVLLSLIFLISLIWIFSTQYIPGTDEGDIQDLTVAILQNDYSMFTNGGYMQAYPCNRGFFLYVISLSKIFGLKNYIVFEVINAIFVSVTYYAMGEIILKLGGRKIHQIWIYMFGILFFPYIAHSIMIYGNVIGVALAFVAINLELSFFRDYKIKEAIGSCVCISLAVWFKQTVTIYLIAMALFALLKLVLNKKVQILMLIVLLGCGFFIQSKATDFYFENLTGYELDNPCSSLAFIVMGLSDDGVGPGWWNAYVQTSYSDAGFITEKQTDKAEEQIKSRMKEFAEDEEYAFSFFSKKISSTWANPSFQCFVIANKGSNIEKPKWVNNLISNRGQFYFYRIYKIFLLIILIGSFCAILFKRINNLYIDSLVLPMIFVGGVIYLLFWETKARYALIFFMPLIPFAIIGYDSLIQNLVLLRQSKSHKLNNRIVTYVAIISVFSLIFVGIKYKGKMETILWKDTEYYKQYIQEQNIAENESGSNLFEYVI